MTYLKYAAVLLLCATAQAATVTSGAIVFNEPVFTGSNTANLQLSDGYFFSASHTSDGDISSRCNDYGSGCQLSGIGGLALGVDTAGFVSGPVGLLIFQYPFVIDIVHGSPTQTYSMPFSVNSASSYLAYFSLNPNLVCPYPEARSSPTCSIVASGSGTVSETVTMAGLTYILTSATFTFGQTPEPSTYALAMVGFISLAYKRYRIGRP